MQRNRSHDTWPPEAGNTMSDRDMERDLEAIHTESFGWALACCGWHREDAEDVLQAAYLKALDGRARFGGRSSLRTWFFGVVKRTAAEQRRRRLVRSAGLGRWWSSRAAPVRRPAPEPDSRDALERQLLRKLLSGLTRRQRELLHLVFYEGLTIEEASRVLGISLGTARTHYERGKARLRLQLNCAEMSHEEPGTERSAVSRTVCSG
jgi:RNA polymerase sigma-70 factor (ECF subfamily)